MRFKRFMALALAGAMTLAMAGTALADITDFDENGNATLIEKTVKHNEGVSLGSGNSKKITFTLEQASTDKTQVDTTGQITDIEITDENIDQAVKTVLSNSKFTAPGEYNFTLKEVDPKDDNGWRTNTQSYPLKVWVTNNNGTLKYQYAIVDGENKVDKAAFENVYAPISGDQESGSITVTKTVDNPSSSPVTNYEFTVTFTDGAAGTLTQDLKAENADCPNKDAKLEGTTYTFTLKEGETCKITGVPQGVTYTVSEKDELNEQKTYGNEFDKAEYTKAPKTGKLTAVVTEVEVKNIFNSINPTGLALNMAPFVAMFAAVAGAIALYIAGKRRVR